MVLGGIITLVAMGLVGYAIVVNGWIPARGDVAPGAFEKWAAKSALHATLKREAQATSPIAADERNLMAGTKVYAQNCAGCHGTPLDQEPDFSKGFFPKPTLFGKGDLITDDPEGHTYWKIKHGIKFTGMPSFAYFLSEKEMWQVTLLLRHMDALPPVVASEWKNLK